MNTLNRLLHTLVERFGRLYLQGRAKRPQIPQTHTAALAQMALQHILERGKQSRNIRFSQRSGHYDVVDDALTVNIAVLNNLTTVSIGFSTLVFELTENILYHGKIKFIRLVMCKVILISRCSQLSLQLNGVISAVIICADLAAANTVQEHHTK